MQKNIYNKLKKEYNTNERVEIETKDKKAKIMSPSERNEK